MELIKNLYSPIMVQKAIETTVMGFTRSNATFKKHVSELPEELKFMVALAVLQGHEYINGELKEVYSQMEDIRERLRQGEKVMTREFKDIF